jgi:uncharacterized protein YjbI with pentapeptide repeats
MKARQFSDEQIVTILQAAEKGDTSIAALCKQHGITENTLNHWRRQFGGLSVEELTRLREDVIEIERRITGEVIHRIYPAQLPPDEVDGWLYGERQRGHEASTLALKNLQGAQLPEADLGRQVFDATNLRGANLRGATF